MSKEIKIATSPLTNTIYVGTNLLSGTEAKEVLSKVLAGCHITL